MSDQTPYSWLDKSLSTIHKANWYRSVRAISGLSGTVVSLSGNLSGKTAINFASNNYLGLAGDERLIDAAVAATKEYGTGSTGSRLLSGHRQLHQELEQAIASLKQTESALVFSSGYLANLGVISAIVSQKDLILGDIYNHSSLKKGAILSGATTIDYEHCDINDLTHKLQQYRSQYRRCLIISDTVFSMDGDLCPLPDLIRLAQQFDCMLLLDEAHATGVMGANGGGCVEYFNCTGTELIQVGTLSKALGSLGGYIAGSSQLVDFLRNRAATWIYTTGLSPADTAAALAAIKIVKNEPERRQKLWHNINYLSNNLPQNRLLPSESPIICLGLDSPQAALAMAEKLQDKGVFAPAIRPPTVPTSRLRFSVMATHQLKHLEHLIDSLNQEF